jgi:hypothetical protein
MPVYWDILLFSVTRSPNAENGPSGNINEHRHIAKSVPATEGNSLWRKLLIS